MTPIKLCLASRFYYPIYSGGAQRFKRYLPGLRDRNVETYVFTGTPVLKRAKAFNTQITWQDTPVGQMMPLQMTDNAPVHRLRLPDAGVRRSDMLYSRQLVKFSRQPTYQADLVQFLPLQLWYAPALLQLRRLKIPTVATYNLLRKRPSKPINRFLQDRYWRFPFQLVDCVLVNSSFMRENLRNVGVTTRIEVIPNGVNTNHFHPERTGQIRQKIRQSLNIGQDENVIIAVGSVEPRKGTDLLLEAWSHLAQTGRSSHLLIVGPRPDRQNPTFAQFHQKLKTLATASRTPEKVHFVGQVNNVADYLRAADLFVFTSRREGLPNVVLEAMSTALPVIMTPFLGLSSELGQANRHYRLAERTPHALAETIQQLLDNRGWRQQLGETARHWVEAELDVEKSLDQLAFLYAELAHPKKP
ncbi:MAG: glycosyltransferase family 4 protein [Chloroflexi bacterium]|nr:glycosyltransferase family 4 protein [Chloroflexota bacterium]